MCGWCTCELPAGTTGASWSPRWERCAGWTEFADKFKGPPSTHHTGLPYPTASWVRGTPYTQAWQPPLSGTPLYP